MQAAAHTPGGYGGVSQATGREFGGKDANKDTLAQCDALRSRADDVVRRMDAMERDCAVADAGDGRPDKLTFNISVKSLDGKSADRAGTVEAEDGRKALDEAVKRGLIKSSEKSLAQARAAR